ncbi:hypothetical protein SAMD00019534_113530 [Acytostelium subglobosum LB1]|uniref:hypothetical protein n=1 Tax=Acytostelium subglobosum LB1 TaxID=1410327 RepID=UPI0006449DB8|nr:hypothetical protein SAMD00019534_113530 [Acytostelium subglobosum LB1]GAM28177.1 hypothetical protein SAMD00019534_113530 [Acytostelium subglobosum LB1]|eukprot:XP_012748811.1 hypothetical protein SAMD00019534_113530 [Acytostelium subglobosum LB1]
MADTQEQMFSQRISQQYSNNMFRHRGVNAEIEVVLKYADGQERSGTFTKVGQPINLYDGSKVTAPGESDIIEDPAIFNQFSIFIHSLNPRGGCTDNRNHCLYDCIKEVYPKELIDHFGKPYRLKKFLGLDDYDPVHYRLIPRLEDKLGIRIQVNGEYSYDSTATHVRSINLKLTNGHYSLIKASRLPCRIIYKGEHNKDVYIKPVSFKLKGDMAELWDGVDQIMMPLSQFYDEDRNNYRSKTQFIRSPPHQTLQQTLDQFVSDADALKAHTNGAIDMYFTGHNINNAALDLFYKYNQTVEADHLELDEAQWIAKASSKAFQYSEPYEGPLYKYDVSAMYAAIMKSSTFAVPTKKGKFQRLTDAELVKCIPFGIYRATINGSHRAFQLNYHNYYTHYNLTFAQELGLTFNLIDDSENNALLYPTGRVTGSIMFGEYINQVLGWKAACEPKSRLEGLCKQLYQRLWGALAKKTTRKKHVVVNTEPTVMETKNGKMTHRSFECNVRDCDTILSVTAASNGNVNIKLGSSDKMYVTPFARIMPFIISRGRKMIGTIIKDDIDNIKRVHTDGFVSTKPWTEKTSKQSLDYPKIGEECGDLKYEGFCPDAIVTNMRKTVGEFKYNSCW